MDNKTYMEAASRTVSDKFFDDVVSRSMVLTQLCNFELIGRQLDAMKKAIYYGKPLKSVEPIEVIEPETAPNPDELHFFIGMVTELVEISQVLRDKWAGKDVGNKLADEMGDLDWYRINMYRVLGLDPEVVAEANIAKLRARFPDKFTTGAAIDRNESNENEALNGVLKS